MQDAVCSVQQCPLAIASVQVPLLPHIASLLPPGAVDPRSRSLGTSEQERTGKRNTASLGGEFGTVILVLGESESMRVTKH